MPSSETSDLGEVSLNDFVKMDLENLKGPKLKLNGKAVYTRQKYDPKMHPQIAKWLCEHQAFRDKDLAEVFDISPRLLYTWKWKYPEFAQALEAGKAACDMEIMDSVKEEICGYWRDEIQWVDGEMRKTPKWYRGNPQAGIQWLRIRMKEWQGDEEKRETTERQDLELFLKLAMKKMQEKAKEDGQPREGQTVQLDYRPVDQDSE